MTFAKVHAVFGRAKALATLARKSEWETVQRPSFTLALLTGAALTAAVVLWEPGFRVVDGDTLDHGYWRWRMAGWDTPETQRAKCAAERVRGERAAARLRELVAGDFRLEVVRGRDPHNRRVARFLAGGRDAGEALAAEGLAQPWTGRGPKPAWCE